MPNDQDIEAALRTAVQAQYNAPDDKEPPTINIMRAKAAQKLGLDEDFFKSGDWKVRSKTIIQDQFDKSDAAQKHKAEAQPEPEQVKSLKRISLTPNPRPKKKSRLSQLEDEDNGSTTLSEPPDSSEDEFTPVKQKKAKQSAPTKVKAKPKAKTKVKARKQRDSSDLSDAPSINEDAEEDEPATKPIDDDTSSELSSVIDDPEPPRKKSKARNGDSSKTSSNQRRSSKSKVSTEPDPNAEEIKRLQGWLVKCGIRKVWGKELKPYESPKAKIAHLKSMLANAGMAGRYSNERAAQIKESRELAADIEAVQEGNERWGKASNDDDDDDGEDGSRPRRRLIRGAQNYDFLSSDGEETD